MADYDYVPTPQDEQDYQLAGEDESRVYNEDDFEFEPEPEEFPWDDEPTGIDDDFDFDPYAGQYEQFHEEYPEW